MAETKIDQVTPIGISSTDFDSSVLGHDTTIYKDFFKIPNLDTDGSNGSDETTFQPDFTKWHGIYRTIPEYKALVDKLGSWTIGTGFKADDKTMKTVEKIKGWGKDDFNSICENQLRVSFMCGDSFAEIIRDKGNRLINLKPLNPGSMKIVLNKAGILKRYEQVAQLEGNQNIPFEPKEIFHLSWNRIADEMHGIPIGEMLQDMIRMRNGAMLSQEVIIQRMMVPITVIPVDEDDPSTLNTLKTKWIKTYKKAEPLFVPKNTFDIKNMRFFGLPEGGVLNPIEWMQYLIRVFSTAGGVPEIVMGWGGETTEAAGKITYVGFEQTIQRIQRWFEAQLKMQTGIEIELEFNKSLLETLVSDEKKDTPPNKERKSEVKP